MKPLPQLNSRAFLLIATGLFPLVLMSGCLSSERNMRTSPGSMGGSGSVGIQRATSYDVVDENYYSDDDYITDSVAGAGETASPVAASVAAGGGGEATTGETATDGSGDATVAQNSTTGKPRPVKKSKDEWSTEALDRHKRRHRKPGAGGLSSMQRAR